MKKLILIILLLSLSGCYDYNELNELNIVSSMIIDYDLKNKYTVTVEILNTDKESKTPSKFISANSNNLTSAIKKVENKTSYKNYYSHMQALILSKNFVNNKMPEIFDLFTRDINIKKDFQLFMVEDTKEIMNYKSLDKKSFGSTISSLVSKNNKYLTDYKTTSFRNAINANLNGINYYIGKINFNDNELILKDSYFIGKNNKPIFINSKYIETINFLENKKLRYQLGNRNNFEIYSYNVKKSINNDSVTFRISGDLRILNSDSELDYNKKNIKIYNKKLENTVDADIKKLLIFAKKVNLDLLNLQHKYNLYFPNSTIDWKELDVNIKLNLNINEKGLISKIVGEKNGK